MKTFYTVHLTTLADGPLISRCTDGDKDKYGLLNAAVFCPTVYRIRSSFKRDVSSVVISLFLTLAANKHDVDDHERVWFKLPSPRLVTH